MNTQSSVSATVGCVLLIVANLCFVSGELLNGVVGTVNGLVDSGSGSSSGLLGSVLGGGSKSSSGLFGGVLGGGSGSSSGLVGSLLNGGEKTMSNCEGSVKNMAGSTGSTVGLITNSTSQQSTCGIINIKLLVSLVAQNCGNCSSAEDCMTAMCQQNNCSGCDPALLSLAINILFLLKLMGTICVKVESGLKITDQLKLLSNILAALGINLNL